jgi:hypothetical protein
MKKYLLIIIILVLLLGISIGVILMQQLKFSQPQISILPTPATQDVVGGDKDEHGCIGSAGYTWCELKQKCLRAWEEPCKTTETPSPSASIIPTIDETNVLIAAIKQALVAKHGNSANGLNITVSKIVGNYAKGGASEQGGGGMWFAAKINGKWNLVWDGNGIIECKDIATYPSFPASIVPECYDSSTNQMVKR